MPVFNNVLAGAAGSGGAGAYKIERSLRFLGDGAQSYLSKNLTNTGGSNTTFTLSFWTKVCSFDSTDEIFAAGDGTTSTADTLRIGSGRLQFFIANQTVLQTDGNFRDPSAWYHIVLQANAPAYRLWVNGVLEKEVLNGPTSFTGFNQTPSAIGRRQHVVSRYFDGYLAEMHFVDGQALDQTSFGEFDADTGVWNPKRFSGTYGTNGFYLNFSDNTSTTSGSNAGIGKDSSGNGNYWDSNNIDPRPSISGFNFDPTSTSFTDAGTGLAVTNVNNTSTVTATTNSFNLTTVADFNYINNAANDNYLYFAGPQTVPTDYTVDYYYRLENTTQPSNASVLDLGGEFIRDYGTSSGRTIRLKDTNNSHTDYSYSVTAGSWNHVRVSPTGIWVNGNQVNSSPKNISGTSGALTIGSYNNNPGFVINGQIGPVRITPKDLGAPPANGLVANSDGTLTTETVTNSATDSFIDSPTNYEADSGNNGGNYATWNPLDDAGGMSLSDGNLKATSTSSNCGAFSTIAMTSGKWYWEQTIEGQNSFVGISNQKATTHNATTAKNRGYSSSNSLYYYGNTGTTYGTLAGFAAQTNVGATFGAGDIIGTALDMDNGTVAFYKNGTLQSTLSPTNLQDYTIVAAADNGGGQATVNVLNAGQRPFAHTPPTGFKPLCTQYFDDSDAPNGSEHFDIALYEGNDSVGQSITGVEFSPDLLWIKDRDNATQHLLFDEVRGYTRYFWPTHVQAQQSTNGNTDVTGFTTDGFTLSGNVIGANRDQADTVAWMWNAGDTNTATNAGSLNSQFYDQSQRWRNYLTSDIGWHSSYPVSAAFNGVFDGGGGAATNGSNGTVTFSPPAAITVTSMELSVYSTVTVTFPDGTTTTVNGVASNDAYRTVSLPAGFNFTGSNSITLTSSGYVYIERIRINGKELVDDDVTVTNVPSVNTTVRAHPTGGCSIAEFTTPSPTAACTFAHGLNAKPEFVLFKHKNVNSNWYVYHKDLAGKFILLNSTNAASTTEFSVAPTSSVFTYPSTLMVTGSTPIMAYSFTSVPGYSAFTTFEGNGQNGSSAKFVYLGFRPAFILLKNADQSGTSHNWTIFDSKREGYNVDNDPLYANKVNYEATTDMIDILSNGFKLRTSVTGVNQADKTIIVAAFAENPFKIARGR